MDFDIQARYERSAFRKQGEEDLMEDTKGRVLKHRDRRKGGRMAQEVDYCVMLKTKQDENAVKEFRRKPYSMEVIKRRK